LQQIAEQPLEDIKAIEEEGSSNEIELRKREKKIVKKLKKNSGQRGT
jgi:hypothetical protein